MEITIDHDPLVDTIRRYSVRGNHAPPANGAPQYPPVGSPDHDMRTRC